MNDITGVIGNGVTHSDNIMKDLLIHSPLILSNLQHILTEEKHTSVEEILKNTAHMDGEELSKQVYKIMHSLKHNPRTTHEKHKMSEEDILRVKKTLCNC